MFRDGHWVTIAESQFAHEKQGLEIVNALLTDPQGVTDPQGEHHG